MSCMYHLAIDIGASSGRHVLGWLEGGRLQLEEVYRFENAQIRRNGHDCWDLAKLSSSVMAGIAQCRLRGKIPATVGIDTWGVDFVLTDAAGNLCSDAVAYRDARTQGIPERLEQTLPFARHYARSGIQKAIFNTAYQLKALVDENPHCFDKAERFLMVPDYLNFVLTGRMANEYTDATTTALVNARTGEWDPELLASVGAPARLFGPLSMPGTRLGSFTPAVRQAVGFDAQVILPACHDTGSAYLAVPARDENAIYLSSGTWSIIGVESPVAIATPESCAANFSNEGGAWKRFRFLKNVMGLWMVQSIRRQLNGTAYVVGKECAGEGPEVLSDWSPRNWDFATLSTLARSAADFPSRIDAADERFFAPGSMIGAVREACRTSHQPVPQTIAQILQCVYRSLAESYAREARALTALTSRTYTSLNIVGGGSQDMYLNEMTARTTGLEVFAGPTEGTSIGNLIVQMIASGQCDSLSSARRIVAESFDVRHIVSAGGQA